LAGTGGEGAKFWMSVLTDIRNRGTKDTFFLVCDGLMGLKTGRYQTGGGGDLPVTNESGDGRITVGDSPPPSFVDELEQYRYARQRFTAGS
jgi:putative NADH-flavin reductase